MLTSMASSTMAGNVIRDACMNSGRPAASAKLCGCIQKVANGHLNRKDQRLAATFFRNPHKAQEIRQSDNRTHESFWSRYKVFGNTAEASCRSYTG